MNPNTRWSGSLESYHPYLSLQNFKKIYKYIEFTAPCKKMSKAILTAFVFKGLMAITTKFIKHSSPQHICYFRQAAMDEIIL
jgi:hypothetical protein